MNLQQPVKDCRNDGICKSSVFDFLYRTQVILPTTFWPLFENYLFQVGRDKVRRAQDVLPHCVHPKLPNTHPRQAPFEQAFKPAGQLH